VPRPHLCHSRECPVSVEQRAVHSGAVSEGGRSSSAAGHGSQRGEVRGEAQKASVR
jgi:hypothetical protein